MSLTQYLLEFSVCLALFYALYHFLLRRETYFQLNRVYLLLTPLLAMTIPFLDWEIAATQSTGNWDQLIYPIVTDIQEQQTVFYERLGTPASEEWTLTYLDLLLLVYAIGMLWMAGRLMYRTWRLMRLIGESSQETREGYTVITPDESIPAASFLSYVFWKEGPLSPERQRILEHELVHVRQWHSLDVLLMEVWVAVKWFHPMIYWYRNSLRLTHEYIADAYVSARNGSRLEYAKLLTSSPGASSKHTLLHLFNSSIKMRLIMLAKQPSRNWKYLKFLTVLPITVALMLLFSFNLAEELPNELVDPLLKAEQTFNGLVNQPVLPKTIAAPEEFVAKDYKIQWGDLECNCRSEQYPNLYHCENQSILPKDLRKLVRREGGFELVLDGAAQPIRELRATSKNAIDMGEYISQLDEMPEGFKADSPFWKKADKGDVFHFNFHNGDGDYFEFDIVINNRREEFVFGHQVEMGDYKFNLDLMNNHRVVHMELEELRKFTQAPFRIKKNNSEYYRLSELKLVNHGALRQDQWKRINGDGVLIGDSEAIVEAYPGDQLSFILTSDEGETIRFNIAIRKNSAWDGRKRDFGLLWGEEEFPMLTGKEELQQLLKKPLYLKINDRKFRVDNYQLKVFSHVARREMQEKVKNGETYSGISDREILSPQEYAQRIHPGDQVSLMAPEEVGGYLMFQPMFTVDLDWETAFTELPHLKIQQQGDRITIDNIKPGDFEKILDIDGFNYYQYLYEIDGKKHSGYSFASKELNTMIEQQANTGKLVLNRIISRDLMILR
jgi:hypothetical protein